MGLEGGGGAQNCILRAEGKCLEGLKQWSTTEYLGVTWGV